MKSFSHIVITGASSGIGAALALHYAAPGLRLSLTGRNAARLEDIAEKCRARGAAVETGIIDVTDAKKLAQWMLQIDDQKPIDLLIANAGISAGTSDNKTESPAQIRALFDTNVTGVLNTIEPILPRMQARKHGHIALMSSLAGFRGWPGAPAYCATKAAIKVYGEGLRSALTGNNVNIHVICPGFVRSGMTDVNDFPMPFIISAERAARVIARGINKNHGRIAFPFRAYFFVWLCAALPDAFAASLLQRTPAKKTR